jgi:hypothetical protein
VTLKNVNNTIWVLAPKTLNLEEAVCLEVSTWEEWVEEWGAWEWTLTISCGCSWECKEVAWVVAEADAWVEVCPEEWVELTFLSSLANQEQVVVAQGQVKIPLASDPEF